MANTPEGKIKKKLDTMLKSLSPWVWFYSPQSGIYGKSGIPDRVIVAYGNFIGVECKADRTKKPTALQLRCMKDIEMAKVKKLSKISLKLRTSSFKKNVFDECC